MNAIPRLKHYQGPAILSYGFRPFFFLGACYAAVIIAIWLPIYEGEVALPTNFAPRDWHVHEMLFGYIAAVVTGFLLTAVPNWTGRLPLQGVPLLTLVLIWLAGRIAVALSAKTGWAISGVIDCAFLILVAGAVAREIIAGRNWRNLKVLIPVSVFALANIGFHLEASARGIADISIRLAIATIVVLIMLIGGRIVPSFTRNWLARQSPGPLPAPFGKFDGIAIAFSAAALVVWTVCPQEYGPAWRCWPRGCFRRCGLPVGRDTAPAVTGWCSFFTSLMASYRWALCCSRLGRSMSRRQVPVFTRGWSGPPAR